MRLLERTLPNIKLFTNTWQDLSNEKSEKIENFSNIDLEFHWNFLGKPHTQWLMFRCLSNKSTHMLPELKDVIFTGQMCIQPWFPPKLKHMIEIYELRKNTGGQSSSQS